MEANRLTRRMPPVEPSLAETEYRSVRGVAGPLLFLDRVRGVGSRELARIFLPDGAERLGQVLELDGDRAVVLDRAVGPIQHIRSTGHA